MATTTEPYCPICGARLRRSLAADQKMNLITAWNCPDCHYDSLAATEVPVHRPPEPHGNSR